MREGATTGKIIARCSATHIGNEEEERATAQAIRKGLSEEVTWSRALWDK